MSPCAHSTLPNVISLFLFFLIRSWFSSSPTPLLWSWSKHLISVTHFPHMQTKGCYENMLMLCFGSVFFFFLFQFSYIFSDFRRNIYPLVLLQPFLVFPTFLVHSQPAKWCLLVCWHQVLFNFLPCPWYSVSHLLELSPIVQHPSKPWIKATGVPSLLYYHSQDHNLTDITST